MMGRQHLEQLTDAQRACLRLVYSHHSSKEIAAAMGVSPSAIDKRIERAVQMLQVGSRFEAARLLHDHENAGAGGTRPTGTSDRVPSETIDLPRPETSVPSDAADDPWGLVRRFLGLSPRSGIEGGARVRSTRTERLVRLVVLAALIALASVAIVNVMMTVATLLRTSRTETSPTTSQAMPMSAPREDTRMLKQRRHAADLVTAEFLKAEQSVDAAAQMAASCVSTLLQQRAAANLPVSTGIGALQLISDASADLIRARQRFVEAHGALVAVRTEIGLGFLYGDESECPPNNGALPTGEVVKLVA